jgi:hypothetical protein
MTMCFVESKQSRLQALREDLLVDAQQQQQQQQRQRQQQQQQQRSEDVCAFVVHAPKWFLVRDAE